MFLHEREAETACKKSIALILPYVKYMDAVSTFVSKANWQFTFISFVGQESFYSKKNKVELKSTLQFFIDIVKTVSTTHLSISINVHKAP